MISRILKSCECVRLYGTIVGIIGTFQPRVTLPGGHYRSGVSRCAEPSISGIARRVGKTMLLAVRLWEYRDRFRAALLSSARLRSHRVEELCLVL